MANLRSSDLLFGSHLRGRQENRPKGRSAKSLVRSEVWNVLERHEAMTGFAGIKALGWGDKTLALLFLLTAPLINPWVRGDGVGYYAFARSLLIEHDLNFEKDWQSANASFRMDRIDETGQVVPGQYTSTGHLNNHFTIGPAILWSPFLILAHLGVLFYDGLGGNIPADGYSRPYMVAMALGTALYGFFALWISYRLARRYVADRFAFLATLGIWFGSSLPVYMYFNPSWSHAHSAFTVALFVWYWQRTRDGRTSTQWVILGIIAGLMMNVYYLNVILLLFPIVESLALYRKRFGTAMGEPVSWLFLQNSLFAAVTLAAFLPTLVTKKIIYGSFLNFGYTEHWFWTSPALLKVCFSSEHGLFAWTPILVPAVTGLFFLLRIDRHLGLYSIAVFGVYLYAIGCYQNWHGIASFGNRFFVSLTILFIVGLAASFDWLAHALEIRRATSLATSMTAVFILWNLGLVFQWGMHLIPARGPVSWRDAAYNQFAVVPLRATHTVEDYLTRRKQLMGHIEDQDMKQLKSQPSEGRE